MRIGVNARFLLPHKMEGFGWFSYETIRRMVLKHPEHEFVLFFDRSYDAKFVFASNVTPVVVKPPARHPLLFKIWFDYALPRQFKKYKIDIFYSPDGYISTKTNVKQIAVMHDIYFEHYPKDIIPSHLRYLKKSFPIFAQKADKLVTVSEFSKKDIAETYQLELAKIRVAYNGATELYRPISEDEKNSVKAQFSSGNSYFLFVGALQPRKNITRLLIAFNAFKAETKSEHKLLLVGDVYFLTAEMRNVIEKSAHASDIVFLGHMNGIDLAKLMAAAEALTFVSYFEGFGIPLLEAMQCGTPVLIANTTSLPEIAGGAALCCDPFDVTSIQSAITELATNPTLRNELSAKGLERASFFSWDKTAAIIMEEIETLRQ